MATRDDLFKALLDAISWKFDQNRGCIFYRFEHELKHLGPEDPDPSKIYDFDPSGFPKPDIYGSGSPPGDRESGRDIQGDDGIGGD